MTDNVVNWNEEKNTLVGKSTQSVCEWLENTKNISAAMTSWYIRVMSQYIKTDPSQTINGEMKYRREFSLPAK